jgi:hypothetical protein
VQVVGVAHRRGSGAAAGGAAEVSCGELAALPCGDRVAQRLEAPDLPQRGQQDAADPGVAQQRFDAGSGLRSGPGGGGAGLFGAHPALAGQGGGDGVGERAWLVVRAARSARVQVAWLLLGGGPVGGQDVAQLRP